MNKRATGMCLSCDRQMSRMIQAVVLQTDIQSAKILESMMNCFLHTKQTTRLHRSWGQPMGGTGVL